MAVNQEVWSAAQEIVRRAGAPESFVPVMYGVGMAESGGRLDAHNPNGEDSRGWFQINRRAWPQFSPEFLHTREGQITAAAHVLKNQGLNAWTTYTGGHYQQYVPQGGGGMAPPQQARISIEKVGPALQSLGYKPITSNPNDRSTWGPQAIWEVPVIDEESGLPQYRTKDGLITTDRGKGKNLNTPITERYTEAALAELAFGDQSPYAMLKDAGGADTREIAGNVMQWNPQTNRYDINLGASGAGNSARIDERGFITSERIAAQGFTAAENAADRGLTASQNAANRALTASEGAENRSLTVAENARDRSQQTSERIGAQGFTAGENANDRTHRTSERVGAQGFTAGENALDRSQRAGEFDRRLGFDQSNAVEGANIDRARLGEDARQANLSSATRGFETVANLAPQFGRLALDNAQFTRDVLKTPADYLARAFFQQGQSSPLPQVSQADVMNQLRGNIKGFNDTLAGFNPQVGAYQAPAPYAPYQTAAPVVASSAVTPAASPPAAGAQTPVSTGIASSSPRMTADTGFADQVATLNAFQNAHPEYADYYNKQQVTPPKMAAGGFTDAPEMMVGDSRSGRPTGFEEVIHNPTGAPLAVTPLNGPAEDPEAAERKKKADAIGKVIPQVEDTDLQHRLVDEMAKHREEATPRDPMPRFASGTGLFGFNIPEMPMPGVANQTDIQSLERSVRPPAINSILGGGLARSPNFGFELFTPQQIRSITPESREALGTTLASQFNETLENVGYAQEQRFGRKRANGRAAQVAGFAS